MGIRFRLQHSLEFGDLLDGLISLHQRGGMGARCVAQCTEFGVDGAGAVGRRPQLAAQTGQIPFVGGVLLEEASVVPVQLLQFVILRGQRVGGLAQFQLDGLQGVVVAPQLQLALSARMRDNATNVSAEVPMTTMASNA